MSMLAMLLGVCIRNAMRRGGDDLLALVVVIVRFLFVSVPRADQAVAARLAEFRGDLAEELEVVRVAPAMAGPPGGSDRYGIPVGASVDGVAGAMDLLVLFVRLFLVVDVWPPPKDRLDQVDAQRATGSGAGLQLAAGLLPQHPPHVPEKNPHEGSPPPPSPRGGQGVPQAPHVRDHQI